MKGPTYGIATLNQAILKGIPSCQKVSRRGLYFSASLPLLAFINNLSLMKPSLDPSCSGGGVHVLDELTGTS